MQGSITTAVLHEKTLAMPCVHLLDALLIRICQRLHASLRVGEHRLEVRQRGGRPLVRLMLCVLRHWLRHAANAVSKVTARASCIADMS